MNMAFKKPPRINELLKSAFAKKFSKVHLIEDVPELSSMRSVVTGTEID